MNLAQAIDPERALRQEDRKSPFAPAPTVRTHLQEAAADGRHAATKLDHPHRPTAGDGTSRRALQALVASAMPLYSKQLAQLLNITRAKASMAVTHLYDAQFVLRVNDKRPYQYKPTEKGRQKCT